jgi:hypothetical protein
VARSRRRTESRAQAPTFTPDGRSIVLHNKVGADIFPQVQGPTVDHERRQQRQAPPYVRVDDRWAAESRGALPVGAFVATCALSARYPPVGGPLQRTPAARVPRTEDQGGPLDPADRDHRGRARWRGRER